MSESLRNDGRIWVPKSGEDKRDAPGDSRGDRDYYLERIYPSFGNLVPRDIASRAAKNVCDEGRGVGPGRARASTSTSPTRSSGSGGKAVEAKYGNLFDMYAQITGEDPYADADADLPGRALHDGRALGRLRPAVHDPRALRHRRGQLLRPRREPARRQRADAGPGRRLLRAAEHHQRLPRRRAVPKIDAVPPGGGRGSRRRSEARIDKLLSDQRHPDASTPSTASSATSCGTTAGWSGPKRACARRST